MKVTTKKHLDNKYCEDTTKYSNPKWSTNW